MNKVIKASDSKNFLSRETSKPSLNKQSHVFHSLHGVPSSNPDRIELPTIQGKTIAIQQKPARLGEETDSVIVGSMRNSNEYTLDDPVI
jgi:hypothetical protein